MGGTKTVEDNYKIAKIPTELSNQIDAVIANSNLGYKSRSEFTKEAIRRHLRKIKGDSEGAF